MATEDELRRLGLGLGASPSDARYAAVRKIFGQPQKQAPRTQSSLPEARIPNNPLDNVGFVQKIGRDGQPYFTPDSSQSVTIQPVFRSNNAPSFSIPLISEIFNTLKKSNFNFKEIEEIDDIDNFIGNNPLDNSRTAVPERSDKQLLIDNVQGNKFSKTLPTGLVSLIMKGLGKLEAFQTQNEINKRGGQLELAALLANTQQKGEGNFFQRLGKSKNVLKTVADTFTGKTTEQLVNNAITRADELNKINMSLAPNVPQQIEDEKAKQANPFERERETIAQQEQQKNQQQQILQDQERRQQLQIPDDVTPDIPSLDAPPDFNPLDAPAPQKEGGKIQQMQEGGEVAEAPAGEGMEMAGVINNPNAAPAGANADDVPMDVPEGSFIINAEAVQEVGLKDIYKAMDEAIILILKTGLGPQLPEQFRKEDRETVPILASNGEVMIPPIIAKMIGEETLNKWNNKGRAIQEAKAAEEQQRAEQQAQQQQAPVMEAPMQQGMA
jgi:hypothetical protein